MLLGKWEKTTKREKCCDVIIHGLWSFSKLTSLFNTLLPRRNGKCKTRTSHICKSGFSAVNKDIYSYLVCFSFSQAISDCYKKHWCLINTLLWNLRRVVSVLINHYFWNNVVYLKLWSMLDGALLKICSRDTKDSMDSFHGGWVTDLHFSPDNRVLVSTGGYIKVHTLYRSLYTSKRLEAHPGKEQFKKKKKFNLRMLHVQLWFRAGEK